MNNLSNTELNNVCLSILEAIEKDYNHYYPHVYFMFYYGVRIGETFNYSIAYDNNSSKIVIYPQKKNNPRMHNLIDSETLENLEKLQIKADLFWINKRNLQRIIEKVNPYRKLYCGKKCIGAHIFRHNWVKQQLALGQQIVNINSMLGYTWQNVGTSYAISKIYY